MTEICYFCNKPIEGEKIISKYTGMHYHSKCHSAYNKEETETKEC